MSDDIANEAAASIRKRLILLRDDPQKWLAMIEEEVGYAMAAETAALQAENRILKDDMDEISERMEALRKELACPDCGCADAIDAESQECGCDSPLCERTYDDGTLAEHWLSLRSENERLRERCEELEANWKAEQAARLDTANVVDLYSAAKCKRQITQLTAERDELRKKAIDLEGMLATAHEAAAKAMAERDAANQRAKKLQKAIKMQCKHFENARPLCSDCRDKCTNEDCLRCQVQRANQRAERAEKKLKDLQAKCIETGWFDKPKEA